MPIYEAECSACEVHAEYTKPVAQCMETPECVVCGEPMKKVIRTPATGFVTGKFEAFVSPVDGSLITSQREMKLHNDRNGVVNVADGYSNEAVISGAMATPPPKLDIKELKADIAEATAMVQHGYKPTTEVYTDDY